MNMNDKDWNEIWDNEPEDDEDDDDDYNDLGSDVDAKNDDTFDNAAEWNEDEHEELIARDLTQHTTVRTNSFNEPPKRTGWSPFGGQDLFATPDSPTQVQFGSLNQQNLIGGARLPQSLTLEQQQQFFMLQQQELRQMVQRQLQMEREQTHVSQNPQCFTVEELERQIIASRSSNTRQHQQQQRHHHHQNQQQQQPQQQQPQQQQQQAHHYCNLAIAMDDLVPSRPVQKHQNNRHQNKDEPMHNNNNNNRNDRRDGERFDRHERFDRDLRESRDHRDNNRKEYHQQHQNQHQHREHRENKDHRDHHRDMRDHREHRDHRGHQHRQHNNNRRPVTIIPPQVQLKVIDEAKRLHSITAMHSDEFLQDRMPTSKDGFHFKRHSTVMNEKALHDGVLTEKERNWLTRIQEKIQADYDDKLDQDYYYLLYFNRSSMTNEAAQKPCGPGVSDRRFIPRERLLYNNV